MDSTSKKTRRKFQALLRWQPWQESFWRSWGVAAFAGVILVLLGAAFSLSLLFEFNSFWCFFVSKCFWKVVSFEPLDNLDPQMVQIMYLGSSLLISKFSRTSAILMNFIYKFDVKWNDSLKSVRLKSLIFNFFKSLISRGELLNLCFLADWR